MTARRSTARSTQCPPVFAELSGNLLDDRAPLSHQDQRLVIGPPLEVQDQVIIVGGSPLRSRKERRKGRRGEEGGRVSVCSKYCGASTQGGQGHTGRPEASHRTAPHSMAHHASFPPLPCRTPSPPPSPARPSPSPAPAPHLGCGVHLATWPHVEAHDVVPRGGVQLRVHHDPPRQLPRAADLLAGAQGDGLAAIQNLLTRPAVWPQHASERAGGSATRQHLPTERAPLPPQQRPARPLSHPRTHTRAGLHACKPTWRHRGG